MTGPNLASRMNAQEKYMRRMDRAVSNIEQRLSFLEVKMDHLLKSTKDGNGTRNIIAVLVAAKVLFEGFSSIDMKVVTELFKLFNGG